jgi:toxin ParE1/3/4
MQYRISEDAERDLEEIFVYWANRASLESADRIVDRITERFWLVGEHPNAGKPAGNIARGVRCFPAGKYLIYYRDTRRGTDILHIFHARFSSSRAARDRKIEHGGARRVTRKTSISENYEGTVTLIQSDISTFSRGTEWFFQSGSLDFRCGRGFGEPHLKKPTVLEY